MVFEVGATKHRRLVELGWRRHWGCYCFPLLLIIFAWKSSFSTHAKDQYYILHFSTNQGMNASQGATRDYLPLLQMKLHYVFVCSV